VIDPNGSGSHLITRDGRSLNPVWGRVGIAFDHERLRKDAEPASQVWLMASDGSRRRQLTALPIPRLREGLRPTAFSAGGGVLLAQYEGQNIDQAWIVSVPSGRATALGPALTAASLSRDGSAALVDRGGFLNPPDHGVVESLPLGPGRPTGPAHILAVRGSEPSWNA
jgi:hypothetical protein